MASGSLHKVSHPVRPVPATRRDIACLFAGCTLEDPAIDHTLTFHDHSPHWQKLLSAQRRVLEMAFARKDLGTMLGFLAGTASEHLGGRSAVFLVDESRKTLRYGASSGLEADYIEAINGFEIGPHSPSCGTAAYTGDMVVVGDVASDQLWAPFLALAQRHGIAACWSKPLKDANGIIIGTFAIYHEDPRIPTRHELEAIALLAHTAAMLVERSVADATLQQTVDALKRSEMATREISHRVMNTFQVLEGVLAIKIRSMSDSDAKAATAEALERIRAMSLVHHKLFALTQHSQSDLDASSFLDDLVKDLAKAFAMDRNLALQLSYDPIIVLGVAQCTSLGLLTVELVLNAIKHAFEDGQVDGAISVSLQRDSGGVVFAVRDNGKGLPDGQLVPNKNRLGAKLIQALVADLEAHLTTRNLTPGAEFQVRFAASA